MSAAAYQLIYIEKIKTYKSINLGHLYNTLNQLNKKGTCFLWFTEILKSFCQFNLKALMIYVKKNRVEILLQYSVSTNYILYYICFAGRPLDMDINSQCIPGEEASIWPTCPIILWASLNHSKERKKKKQLCACDICFKLYSLYISLQLFQLYEFYYFLYVFGNKGRDNY